MSDLRCGPRRVTRCDRNNVHAAIKQLITKNHAALGSGFVSSIAALRVLSECSLGVGVCTQHYCSQSALRVLPRGGNSEDSMAGVADVQVLQVYGIAKGG
jgi:hypothetical protein